jgi:hypothetical protein
MAIGVQPQTLGTPGFPAPQDCPEGQLPQVIMPAHPSDTWPQFLPEQATAIERGVHPQTLGIPGLPPPHVWPDGQLPLIEPQVNVPLPQPLSIVPQFFPAGHAVSGVQLLAHVPFAQTIPLGQPPPIPPQLTIPPQPSGTVPQLRAPQAAAAVRGVHPQTLGVEGAPPPHVCGDVQVPQSMVPLQPSET